MLCIILLYRIFTVHLLNFRNILFNIFSIYNLIISRANLTSIYICINLGQPTYIS